MKEDFSKPTELDTSSISSENSSEKSEYSDYSHHPRDSDSDELKEVEVQGVLVKDCLASLGESPLKPISKLTPTYTKEKIRKVQQTLKRKLLDLTQTELEEVGLIELNIEKC